MVCPPPASGPVSPRLRPQLSTYSAVFVLDDVEKLDLHIEILAGERVIRVEKNHVAGRRNNPYDRGRPPLPLHLQLLTGIRIHVRWEPLPLHGQEEIVPMLPMRQIGRQKRRTDLTRAHPIHQVLEPLHHLATSKSELEGFILTG